MACWGAAALRSTSPPAQPRWGRGPLGPSQPTTNPHLTTKLSTNRQGLAGSELLGCLGLGARAAHLARPDVMLHCTPGPGPQQQVSHVDHVGLYRVS